MIDLNGYTREAIQKAMLDRVPRTLDTREGSVIQTALGPARIQPERFWSACFP